MLMHHRQAKAELGQGEQTLCHGPPSGGHLDLPNRRDHLRVPLKIQQRLPHRLAVRQHIHHDITAAHAPVSDLVLDALSGTEEDEVVFAQPREVGGLDQGAGAGGGLGGGEGEGGGGILLRFWGKEGGGEKRVCEMSGCADE